MKQLLLSLTAIVSAAIVSWAADAPQNVTPDQAEKLLKEKKEIVVLDVRTPEEFKDGHIAGAKNVDFQGDDFKKQVAALDKSKTYLVHCAAGGRSSRALKVLEADKFEHVYHLNDGFNGWKQARKPVAK
jgi:rhodanese-related sulfurtransferase